MGERDWQSSEYPKHDRLAGIKLTLARIFGDGENPLAWGFRIGVFRGVSIKLHLLFVVYLLAELIFTLPASRDGVLFVLPRLMAMVLLVLSREALRTIAVRRTGGTPLEIMLWPMGGLIAHDLPDEWGSRIKVALTPVLFNLALLPIFAIPLYYFTRDWQSLLINPLTLRGPESVPMFTDATTTWWLVTLGSIHSVNLTLLVFNALLPMLPLDAAGILESLLMRTRSTHHAQHIVVNTGLATATIVGIVALVMQDSTALFALCVVCGLICSMHRRRLQFLATADMIPGLSAANFEPSENTKAQSPDSRDIDQGEIDRILAKISEQGIGSLSRKEHRTLKRATETSRQSQ